MSDLELRLQAVERYHQSARQAEIKEYWARFNGKSCSLLKYEEVANRLHIRQQIPIGHRMVPLHHIVGSVGRYREFTQGFLPRATVMQDRWVAVDVTMNSLWGLPPIELYKIGEGYFVIDGNHRISVARANGNKDIEAHVIEHQTSVPFTLADFAGDKWLVKAVYGDFLAQTKLDQLRPQVELAVSNAEHYETLLQHIAVHRYLSNKSRHNGAVMSWEAAVTSWYDTIYTPIVEAIRSHKVQVRFPKRTLTDLYITITSYRERVAEEYGLAPLGAESAVRVFAANHGERILDRLLLSLRQSITPQWRWGEAKRPAGMTPEEFAALRLRHAAGELSVTEAGRMARPEEVISEALCEMQFAG
jgi:hypothetical protein